MTKQLLTLLIIGYVCLIQILSSYSQTQSTSTSNATNCNLKRSSDREQDLLKKLEKKNLTNKQFTFDDTDHFYSFGVCAKAEKANESDVGFFQTNKNTSQNFIIGKLNDVDLEGSEYYIRLTYKNGDKYNNACGKAERNAVIIFLCNPYNNTEIFSMLEENNERGDDCAYVFQLLTPLMCDSSYKLSQNCTNNQATTPSPVPPATKAPPTAAPTTAPISAPTASKLTNTTPISTTAVINSTTSSSKSPSSKLGFFSISLIVLTAVLFSYFFIGTLYNRFVHQTRGIEQLPHWRLWHTLAIKLQTLGQFVCQCGKKPAEIRSYEHINDQLSDDENLLNM